MVDGLFRVNIFQNKYGKFAVNEFESLEAKYSTDVDFLEAAVCQKLEDYWSNIINNNIKEFPKTYKHYN
jgi:hypothetical protein